MTMIELLERPTSPDNDISLHECATCRHKERVYVSSPDGKKIAAVWRCRTLSQKTQREVLVQPHENCYEHRSLSDYWESADAELVR